MSYNARRGGGGGGNYMAPSAASVGQRRQNSQAQQQPPQIGKNFVSGGQLPNKPAVPMAGQHQGVPRQQTPMQQQQKPPQLQPNQRVQQIQRQQELDQQKNLRQQAQQFLNQQVPPVVPASGPAPVVAPAQPSEQPTSVPAQQDIVFKPADLVLPDGSQLVGQLPSGNATNSSNDMDDDTDEKRSKKTRPFWMKKDGKINKKERLRRRNQRLRKILQPKNALMVLNELIGSAPYNMTENADLYEGTVFKCSVLVDGLEHQGIGKSKPAAKTAAAEAALKHMVLSKLKDTQSLDNSTNTAAAVVESISNITDEVGNIKMEIDADENIGGISWSHVACYALHKLLSSWDEGSNLAEKLAQAAAGGIISLPDKAKAFDKKPAKKLPEAAPTMNPIMLLNQMQPDSAYEEVSKTGNPPHVLFTVRCNVAGESFIASGMTKKGARKMCAFAACRKVLGIQYAPEFLEEHGFTESAVCVDGIPTTIPMQVV